MENHLNYVLPKYHRDQASDKHEHQKGEIGKEKGDGSKAGPKPSSANFTGRKHLRATLFGSRLCPRGSLSGRTILPFSWRIMPVPSPPSFPPTFSASFHPNWQCFYWHNPFTPGFCWNGWFKPWFTPMLISLSKACSPTPFGSSFIFFFFFFNLDRLGIFQIAKFEFLSVQQLLLRFLSSLLLFTRSSKKDPSCSFNILLGNLS